VKKRDEEQRPVNDGKEKEQNHRLDKVETRLEQLRKELALYGIEVPD
jgi:hypothetical protein